MRKKLTARQTVRFLCSAALAAATALVIAVLLVGCTRTSGIRVGYVGSSTSREWNGEYIRLDGTMETTLRPKEGQTRLDMDFETEEGRLAVTVTDKDGNVLFECDDVQNGEFTTEISGSVKVKLTADNHKGGFDIEFE